MNENLLYRSLTEKIIGTFYSVYNELGYGFLETVYEKSLFLALIENGLSVNRQVPIEVFFRTKNVGIYVADLIVEDCVIIELKSAEALCDMHDAQLQNYLKATNIEVGLLLNFGKTPSFRRKVFLNKNPSNPPNPKDPGVPP